LIINNKSCFKVIYEDSNKMLNPPTEENKKDIMWIQSRGEDMCV